MASLWKNITMNKIIQREFFPIFFGEGNPSFFHFLDVYDSSIGRGQNTILIVGWNPFRISIKSPQKKGNSYYADKENVYHQDLVKAKTPERHEPINNCSSQSTNEESGRYDDFLFDLPFPPQWYKCDESKNYTQDEDPQSHF